MAELACTLLRCALPTKGAVWGQQDVGSHELCGVSPGQHSAATACPVFAGNCTKNGHAPMEGHQTALLRWMDCWYHTAVPWGGGFWMHCWHLGGGQPTMEPWSMLQG